MYRVALTGNIASGKSTVARIWAGLGAILIDADELARRAVERGTPGLAAVVERFGPAVLTADGTLDRAALRRIVFVDAGARADLERILHPEIGRLRIAEELRLAEAGTGIVVHVIPLLFEVGLEAEFDEVVLVDAPESVRLLRLVELRGVAEAEARRMVAAQTPAASKRGRATLILDNAGTMEGLERDARAAWRELERRAGSSARKRR
ncbi:MAG: dephospho-CoA kinase [Gemmatimonadota bacterium]|jgi:dephospho-CoA kinase